MGGAILRAILQLWLISFMLVSCAEQPDRPDRGETDTTPHTTAPQTTAASGDYVEHTVGNMTLRQDEGVVAIEEAELIVDEAGRDQIVVRAKIRGQDQENRGCFLMEERSWLALERSFESGNTPDPALPLESSWADPFRSDEFSGGDTYAVVFQEDPDVEAADPGQTPFFALCFKDPEGSGSLTAWYDVAHVEGTPEAP